MMISTQRNSQDGLTIWDSPRETLDKRVVHIIYNWQTVAVVTVYDLTAIQAVWYGEPLPCTYT